MTDVLMFPHRRFIGEQVMRIKTGFRMLFLHGNDPPDIETVTDDHFLQFVVLWFPLRLWAVISNFPNAFFTESRNRLSAGGVKQCVDRFLLRFCEIGKRGYHLAAKIGNSFVKRFHQGECYNLLHHFCIFRIAVFTEGCIINPFLFIPNDDARETRSHELEIDDHSTHPAVAVAKRMDSFEIKMEFCDLVGEVIIVVCGKFPQNCLHHLFDVFRGRSYMGPHADIFARGAETPRNSIVDSVEFSMAFELKTLSGSSDSSIMF